MTSRRTSRSGRKTLSIGGATYDVFVKTGKDVLCVDCDHKTISLPVGHKIRVQEVIETCGGGAANTSVGLSRLGCTAAFCGIVGSDQWGERMLQNLRDEQVDTKSATVIDDETSSFSIILNVESGERVILYSTGVSAHLHDVTFDLDSVRSADWIYFNHIHEKSCVIEDDLIAALRDRRALGLTWNPGGRQLKQGIDHAENRELLKRTSLLLLNKEEALLFTGKQNTERAIRCLLDCGVRVVCVTDGKHGSLASDGRHLYHCPTVIGAPIVDTTGAGDAFGTGATWALLQGFDLPTMLRAGTINATSVLAVTGAESGLLTDIEMQKKLQMTDLQVDVRELR